MRHEPRARGRESMSGPNRLRATRKGATVGELDYTATPIPAKYDLKVAGVIADTPSRTSRTYPIDNETAIRVTDGAAEVVSEGHWRFFPSPAEPGPTA